MGAAYLATGTSAKRQARAPCGSRHAHATFGANGRFRVRQRGT